jgi:hypothetical protein
MNGPRLHNCEDFAEVCGPSPVCQYALVGSQKSQSRSIRNQAGAVGRAAAT